MKKTLLKMSLFLAKHIWLYYVLNCTWGLIMTIIGLIATIFMLPIVRPHRFDRAMMLQKGKSWGGVSIGLTIIRDANSYYELGYHEIGHTFQNAILGPFMPFVVTIPSAIRYWLRRIKQHDLPPYDAIWFEASATEIGNAVKQIVH